MRRHCMGGRLDLERLLAHLRILGAWFARSRRRPRYTRREWTLRSRPAGASPIETLRGRDGGGGIPRQPDHRAPPPSRGRGGLRALRGACAPIPSARHEHGSAGASASRSLRKRSTPARSTSPCLSLSTGHAWRGSSAPWPTRSRKGSPPIRCAEWTRDGPTRTTARSCALASLGGSLSSTLA
jgi:hypothetical protein